MTRPNLLACAVAASLVLLVGPAYAATNLVTNGSFETGTYQPNQFTICQCNIRPGTAAATAMTGWTVVAPANALPASGIDWLQNYPQYLPLPSDGTKNIDLSGDAPGAVQQSVTTTAGSGYTLSFDVGSNNDPSVVSTAAHSLEVIAGPVNQTFTIPRATSGYAHETVHFTAATNLTLIEFISADSPPTGTGPVIDNVVLVPGGGQPEVEDDCDDGGWTTLSDGSGNPFPSQAACIAFATNTTLSSTLPSGVCNNITFTGTFSTLGVDGFAGDASVPNGATCVLAPGSVVTHDFTVGQGATLYVEGATIDHDLTAQMPKGIDMENGITVDHNLNINQIQGVPAGEPANEFCKLVVLGSTSISSAGPQAPIDMSCSTLEANRLAGNLSVSGNSGPITIENADVGKNATVSGNTYSVTVVGNTVKGNLAITNNTRPATLPVDVYAITTAYNNHVRGKATCSGNAKGSSCKVSSGKGSSLAKSGSKKHKGPGTTNSSHRHVKKTRHAKK